MPIEVLTAPPSPFKFVLTGKGLCCCGKLEHFPAAFGLPARADEMIQ